MLCSCEIQGTQHMISIQKLRFSSRPRTEVRTLKCSPGAEAKSTTLLHLSVIFIICFGFQFRVILPFPRMQVSQVHTLNQGNPSLLATQWMEIGVLTTTNVHTLSETTLLGGE